MNTFLLLFISTAKQLQEIYSFIHFVYTKIIERILAHWSPELISFAVHLLIQLSKHHHEVD